MKFSSINIQGNIISSDTLTKISQDDIRYQKPADFGFDRNSAVRDEIGLAWNIAQAHWKAFQLKRDRLTEDEMGTSLTRSTWVVPLLQTLGYDLSLSKAEIINEKSYAISHRDQEKKEGFPIHIVGVHQSLDKRPKFGTRLSPHALVQEYLNNHEHLYAIISNGNFIRILRDATRLSKLSYLEFNLERMMEEELYAEFATMYRSIHASRFPNKQEEGADSIFEFYHSESLASGSRIRERLSLAVEQCIKLLGTGLLRHPKNDRIREDFENGNIDSEEYYLYLLRTIYRLLFLLVIEERHLIYPDKIDEETQKKRKYYYDFYSLQRLIKLIEKRVYVDPHKTDLWDGLLTTFRIFENEKYGNKLGIQPLGSGLFDPNAIRQLVLLKLDNETLLSVLRYLVIFENENQQRTRVNYADLDVEEFGSVYEGLLEYDPEVNIENGSESFSFIKGDGRSSSGAHYTPEELVKPLIKHSLDYIIEDKLKEGKQISEDTIEQKKAQSKALLTISVCDVACGSGHILLSAARRIGLQLAVLQESIDSRSEVEQPSPPYMRKATREVIKHCIYGVDLNPLAVELCKVALWLEAHSPGEPLNFLDHKIKCGNAIVGLAHFDELKNGIANEAFKTLPDDDKEVAVYFRKRNQEELKQRGQLSTTATQNADDVLMNMQQEFAAFTDLPEETPEQIHQKENAYKKLTTGGRWNKLKGIADLQIAQFFIPKTEENQPKLTTHENYYTYLRTGGQISDRGASMAIANEKRFFHWFLEFPEIFTNNKGFDCILGNPPFLGGLKISSNFGSLFLNYLHFEYKGAKGTADMVTYFFRRAFSIIKKHGFQSLISTKSISEGGTRIGGLKWIIQEEGKIIHAVRSMKWPGQASVDVALVTLYKGEYEYQRYLDNKKVDSISSYLDDSEITANPVQLVENRDKSFIGSFVLGDGFLLNKEESKYLQNKDSKNADVIFSYINGDDLNNNIYQRPSRKVINFGTLSQSSAEKQYPLCMEIVRTRVKPYRDSLKGNPTADDRRKRWWQFARPTQALYESISNMKRVIIVAQTTKQPAFVFSNTNLVFSLMTVVFSFEKYSDFTLLQTTFHEQWAWKNGSKNSISLRYTPSNIFETYPRPFTNNESILNKLDNLGQTYYYNRESIMKSLLLGLTKTYNQFHNKSLIKNVERLNPLLFEKTYGKETWNLYNHLNIKKEGEISYEEAVPMIFKLRELHKELDEAVLAAYGWNENNEKWGKAIQLRHDFYEVDYLPENDRLRYTIHPEARKEVLKRLLLLNHERFEEEVMQGLHKKKDVEKYYKEKGEEIPYGVEFVDKKTKSKRARKTKVKEPKSPYKQTNMFEEEVIVENSPKTIQADSMVTIEKEKGDQFKYHILSNANKGEFTQNYKQINLDSALAQAMLGKVVGDRFVFGGSGYLVKEIK